MPSKKVIKTFIIIARMEVEKEKTFAKMFLTPPRVGSELPKGMHFVQIYPLEGPVIVSPKGFKSLEVVRVDSETVLHKKGTKRVISP